MCLSLKLFAAVTGTFLSISALAFGTDYTCRDFYSRRYDLTIGKASNSAASIKLTTINSYHEREIMIETVKAVRTADYIIASSGPSAVFLDNSGPRLRATVTDGTITPTKDYDLVCLLPEQEDK